MALIFSALSISWPFTLLWAEGSEMKIPDRCNIKIEAVMERIIDGEQKMVLSLLNILPQPINSLQRWQSGTDHEVFS